LEKGTCAVFLGSSSNDGFIEPLAAAAAAAPAAATEDPWSDNTSVGSTQKADKNIIVAPAVQAATSALGDRQCIVFGLWF
jgi:hypothetical protein